MSAIDPSALPLRISAERVVAALGFAVRDNAVDDEPIGGVTVELTYIADEGVYSASVGGGSDSYAPTLEMAIVALGCLAEGDSITLDAQGQPVCGECNGTGCDDCGNTGHCDSVPDGWPKGGIMGDDSVDLVEVGWSTLTHLGKLATQTLAAAEDHGSRMEALSMYGAYVTKIISELSRKRGGA